MQFAKRATSGTATPRASGLPRQPQSARSRPIQHLKLVPQGEHLKLQTVVSMCHVSSGSLVRSLTFGFADESEAASVAGRTSERGGTRSTATPTRC
jgi:hypothetical protein